MIICKFCNKEFKNNGGKCSHEPYCKDNPQRIKKINSPNAHKKKGSKGNIPWNKGIPCSEELKSRLRILCTGKAKTPEKELERIEKIKVKSVNNGGYRKGSGRGKKGWYKGIFCDSSWELAYILYCEKHNVKIKRNNDKFPYIFEGKIYNYIPDFKIDDTFIEIKGFYTEQNKAKINQFPHKIIVLSEVEMKPILKEIINLYGKNFINLYN